MGNIYAHTLYCRHLVYSEPGKLARGLVYRGKPAEFVRWLSRAERSGGGVMIRQDGYLWELDTKEVTVTGACPCGCGN